MDKKIKELKKEIKDLKFDLKETKNDCKNLEEENEELKKINREYGDMITNSREWVQYKRDLNSINWSLNRLELMEILNIKERGTF